MEGIREYILSITAAAVISGVLTALMDKKGITANMGKMFCGVFMAIALINPLTDISFHSISEWIDSYTEEASHIASLGEKHAADTIQTYITEDCEAYIQEEAASWGLEVTAKVTLEETPPYAPEIITISGNVSPYHKKSLSGIIAEAMSVQEEDIRWK